MTTPNPEPELTPEQAAYDRFIAVGLIGKPRTWDELHGNDRAEWRAIAQAAVLASRSPVSEEKVRAMEDALKIMVEVFDSDTARRLYSQNCAEGWTMLEISACSEARAALALSSSVTQAPGWVRVKEKDKWPAFREPVFMYFGGSQEIGTKTPRLEKWHPNWIQDGVTHFCPCVVPAPPVLKGE